MWGILANEAEITTNARGVSSYNSGRIHPKAVFYFFQAPTVQNPKCFLGGWLRRAHAAWSRHEVMKSLMLWR